jgi:hypothetical protein
MLGTKEEVPAEAQPSEAVSPGSFGERQGGFPWGLVQLLDHRRTGGSGHQLEQRRKRTHRLALPHPLSRLG